MKANTNKAPRILLIMLTAGIALSLVSWGFKGTGPFQPGKNDTTPPNKQNREKKVQDLDDVIYGWDQAEWKQGMEKAQREIEKAMKQIDMEKMKIDMEKAMRDVDMDKIKKEVEESMKSINWEKMKDQMEKIKDMNLDKMNIEMEKVREQMKELGPQMEKVRVDMEKTRGTIREYTDFVNDLQKDGLINKKENYSIRHKNGELSINGKAVGMDVYNKYRSFLEKHKAFSLDKSGEDFNIDVD